eukprot:399126-Rhodomonas_salina.1
MFAIARLGLYRDANTSTFCTGALYRVHFLPEVFECRFERLSAMTLARGQLIAVPGYPGPRVGTGVRNYLTLKT